MQKTVFAAGSDIKNKFLFAKEGFLYAGEESGDLSDAANYETFKKETSSLAKKINAQAEIIACDLHPAYFSAQFAKSSHKWLAKKHRIVPVQHHHAHIASVMHECGLKGPVIGVSFDGTGYGTDGNIWGGEFLVARRKDFERKAHLKYLMMPGGDKVVFEPWRMVLSVLGEEGASFLKEVPKKDKGLVLEMISKKINAPLTSSAGRLFDAAAALLGICAYASHEAEGPIKLEAMCDKNVKGSYKFNTVKSEGIYIIDTTSLFREMAKDLRRNKKASAIATKFHNSMVKIITQTVRNLSKETGIKKVALSGGVFQNKYLKENVMKGLLRAGFKVYVNKSIPVNDLNIAIGQYYVSSGSSKS